MKLALDAGASLQAYDPVSMPNLNATKPAVKTVDKLNDALDGCQALILCTQWSEVRHPHFDQIAKRMKSSFGRDDALSSSTPA